MSNEPLLHLGEKFYEWYAERKITFICNPQDHHLNEQIDRLAELIEYVKDKRDGLVN